MITYDLVIFSLVVVILCLVWQLILFMDTDYKIYDTCSKLPLILATISGFIGTILISL